jgi:alpha,alpha-trehalase
MRTSSPLQRRISARVGGIALAALAIGCRPVPAPVSTTALQERIYDASHDLGPLFHDVQLARVFPDSKTFVDATPRSAPAQIAARYAAARATPGFDLRAFVAENFDAPRAAGEGVRSDTTQTMEEHIRALWPALTRPADLPNPRSSLIPLPGAYVVPGGRVREVYYWD